MSTLSGEPKENFKVRDINQQSWFWTDNEIIDDFGKQIGPYGLCVYFVLVRSARSGRCGSTLKKLAEAVGISRQSAMRGLQKLEAVNLVRREDSASNQSDETTYWLLQVPKRTPRSNREQVVPIGNGAVPIGNAIKEVKLLKTNQNLNLALEAPPQVGEVPAVTKKSKAKPNDCDDDRHVPFREIWKVAYVKANPDLEKAPWDGSEGKLLTAFLDGNKWVTAAIWGKCVVNYFASTGNPLGKRARSVFLRDPLAYKDGPLDRFGKVGFGRGSPQNAAPVKSAADKYREQLAEEERRHNGQTGN